MRSRVEEDERRPQHGTTVNLARARKRAMYPEESQDPNKHYPLGSFVIGPKHALVTQVAISTSHITYPCLIYIRDRCVK